MDAISLINLRFVYPDVRRRAFEIREEVHAATGYWVRVTRGYSSFAEQKALYDQGRTTPGKIVTNAKPGMSFHNFGLAVDFAFVGMDPYLETMAKMRGEAKADAVWERVAQIVEKNGLVSGRRFKSRPDSPHAQDTYGMELHEVASLYDSGGLPAVWAQCDKIRGVQGEWSPETLPGVESRVDSLKPETGGV